MDPLQWVDEELARLAGANLLRTLPTPLGTAGAEVEIRGQRIINFASNDYLGLAADQRLIDAAAAACQDQGVGRGASPLVSGRATIHSVLEQRLAEFQQTEAALLFPTSFAANAGTIPALVDRGDGIYTDAKNHASIIDGCRLSRAVKHIFPHCNIDALEKLLKAGTRYRRRLIVTDALFSMDGDLAPLDHLGDLADQYNAMLMVDDTHAIGVFGQHGRGAIEYFTESDPAIQRRVQVRVGTFGKALGSAGGFVCGSAPLIQWLANRARTYVFSTAHPAAVSAAALVALDIVDAEPERRTALLRKAQELRRRLQNEDWDVGDSVSQIIPLKTGTPERAMKLSRLLRKQGLWVPAIRPPSVPANGSLLRLGLTAAHTDKMLDSLVDALGAARRLV